jgi:hypothetical protein
MISGQKAEDFETALTDEEEGWRQSPQVKKARELFETVRYVGGDELTARDHATYEYLFNTARHDGMEKESHLAVVGDIMRHLDVTHADRVWESLSRLADVRVTYGGGSEHVRVRGKVSLLNFELTEDLRAGTAVLSYSIPAQVRNLVLQSESYALLEANAFPQFKCKYTARLYPRLALRAGYDAPVRKPWVVEPQKLAEELGYKFTKWNYRHFFIDVLKPVLKDIENHVRRFGVRMDEVRGKGRGRPVEVLAFQTTGLSRRLREIQAATITPGEKYRAQAPDHVHEKTELPSVAILARAVTRTGRTMDELTDGYRAALEQGKKNPRAEISSGVAGGFLTLMARRDGGDTAFEFWLGCIPHKGKLDVSRDASPPEPSLQPSAADRPPIVVDDPFDYVDTMPKDSRPAFDGDECPF